MTEFGLTGKRLHLCSFSYSVYNRLGELGRTPPLGPEADDDEDQNSIHELPTQGLRCRVEVGGKELGTTGVSTDDVHSPMREGSPETSPVPRRQSRLFWSQAYTLDLGTSDLPNPTDLRIDSGPRGGTPPPPTDLFYGFPFVLLSRQGPVGPHRRRQVQDPWTDSKQRTGVGYPVGSRHVIWEERTLVGVSSHLFRRTSTPPRRRREGESLRPQVSFQKVRFLRESVVLSRSILLTEGNGIGCGRRDGCPRVWKEAGCPLRVYPETSRPAPRLLRSFPESRSRYPRSQLFPSDGVTPQPMSVTPSPDPPSGSRPTHGTREGNPFLPSSS